MVNSLEHKKISEICVIKNIDEVLKAKLYNGTIYVLGVRRGEKINDNTYKMISIKGDSIISEDTFRIKSEYHNINDFYLSKGKLYFPATKYILSDNSINSIYSFNKKEGIKEIILNEPYDAYYLNKNSLITVSDDYICEYSLNGKILKKKISVVKYSRKGEENAYVFTK